MALLDKLNALKDQALEKGVAHWEENKDDYKEKAMAIKDEVENKIKEKTRK